MIRRVELRDSKTIADIYNEYVIHSVATFETKPLNEEEMRSRIIEIFKNFPYWVYEIDDRVVGYCYAHPWKQRAAYKYTLETTVYVSPDYVGKGIGKELMQKLIEECRKSGYHALIACITSGNEVSDSLHLKLGFKQVSFFEQVGLKFGRWLDVADYQLLLI